MRRGARIAYLSGAALVMLAAQPHGTARAAAQPAAPVIPAAAGAIATAQDPPGVTLQLPLLRGGRLFGDMVVEAFPDGRVRYSRVSLLTVLSPILSPDGRERFAAALPPGELLTPEQIEQAGVRLSFDQSRLEVVVEQIDPGYAALEVIGGPIERSAIPLTAYPERFSAYLNVVGDFRLNDFQDFEDPGILLFGAVRYRDVVFEFDGGYDPTLTGDRGFYRRQARVVYDEVEQARRWSGGDLQLYGNQLLGSVLLGGVAVERGRRVFTGFAPVQPLNGQQILLDRDATVEVFVDGQQAQTLQLTAGPYDLTNLQIQYGGRNVQLFITDITGRRQLTSFDNFFDPVDLAAGEVEYGAGIGFVARTFQAQPEYGGKPAFSGYYRRGMSNRLILGGALQISEDVQVASAEVVVSPATIPGRLELMGAFSIGDSSGLALRGSYSVQLSRGPRASQFAVSADYRSSGFTTLADQIGFGRFETLNITGSFSQGLSDRTTLVAGLNWFDREGLRTNRRAFVDVVHRARNFRLVAGVEYGTGTFDREFGVRVGISIPFGSRTRAEANYNSRREDFRAFVSRSYDDRVGSFGYDLGVTRSQGNASLDGSATYVGNRFFSRLTVTSAGPGFSNIDDRQFARLQVGTSLAYAGGSFAIGRPINDSFVIARPHESMAGEQVVLGQSVHDRRYDAVSGTLGPALSPRLNSYVRQNIVYDLKDGAQGYDIGTGIHTVEPHYRSGYRLVIGTDATVSAFGYANLPAGRAELVSGTVTSPDDPDFGTQPFFTNSAGRFALIGLRPGKTYEVRLFDPVAIYTIRVPADSGSLFQMGEIMLVPAGNGQE
jgi:outer membrane usher protein